MPLMAAWHENDTFWESFAPFMFTAERIEHARTDLDGALTLLGALTADFIPSGFSKPHF
jgi:hypothetical protein